MNLNNQNRKQLRDRKPTLWVIMFIAVFLLSFTSLASAEDVVIIINNTVPDSSLSKEDVKKIYSGYKTKWSNNESIIVTVLKKSELHSKFLQGFVKKSPAQFKRTWKNMVFSGKGKTPKGFDTIEEKVGDL